MKKFICYECGHEFFSGSRDDMLDQLYAHYMKEHRSVITSADPTEKQNWMNRFEKDWAEAEVIDL
jgi:hypothetical protein